MHVGAGPGSQSQALHHNVSCCLFTLQIVVLKMWKSINTKEKNPQILLFSCQVHLKGGLEKPSEPRARALTGWFCVLDLALQLQLLKISSNSFSLLLIIAGTWQAFHGSGPRLSLFSPCAADTQQKEEVPSEQQVLSSGLDQDDLEEQVKASTSKAGEQLQALEQVHFLSCPCEEGGWWWRETSCWTNSNRSL